MEEISQVVVFKLGNESYGATVDQVKEIIKMIKPNQIPQTKKYVEGLINLRGKIHTVLNLRKRFDLEGKESQFNTEFGRRKGIGSIDSLRTRTKIKIKILGEMIHVSEIQIKSCI